MRPLLLLPAALGLCAAQSAAPLPGLNAPGLPTQGLVTLVTTVPSYRTVIPRPTVVVVGSRTWSVTAAPATLTVSEGCPCAVTTTRCLGPDCYYKGPELIPDLGGGVVVVTGTTAAPAPARPTKSAELKGVVAGGGSLEGDARGQQPQQQKGVEGKKAASGASAGGFAAAGEVVFGVVAGVVLAGVLMVL